LGSLGSARLSQPGGRVTNGWDKFFLMHYQNDDEEVAVAQRKAQAFLGKRNNIMTVNVVKGAEMVEDSCSEQEKSKSRSGSGIAYSSFFLVMKK
jgi:hypothetical protein